MLARATRAAVLATFTIALGHEARSSGSSSSVRRTTASKLIAIVRCTVSEPPSANVLRQEVPALLTSSVTRPSCSRSSCSRIRVGASSSVRSTATKVAGHGSASANARRRSSRRATSTSRVPGSRASR